MSWVFRRMMQGIPTPALLDVTLGATLVAGTPVALETGGTGKVVGLAAGDTAAFLGVITDGGDDGDVVGLIPAMPGTVFEVPVTNGPAVFGTDYDIDGSDNLDVADVTNPKIKVIGPGADGLYATTCEVVGIGLFLGLDTSFSNIVGALPPIRGTWFFVDPLAGSDSNSGTTPALAFDGLAAAYAACTTNVGDGICLLSGGSTSSADITSYLDQEILWAKNGITVVGVCSPTGMYQRARVANRTRATTAQTTISHAANAINRSAGSFLTDGWAVGMKGVTADSGSNNGATFTVTAATALSLTISETFNVQNAAAVGSCTMTSYNVNLITVSGSGNYFKNILFWNGGTNSREIGGVVVSGSRNTFEDCHIVGGAGATAAATHYSLKLSGVQDSKFERCVIGTDTVDRGDNADCDLWLYEHVSRCRFNECEFLSYVGSGTAHAAVKLEATTEGRGTVFTNCLFNSSTSVTTPAAVFIATGNNDKVLVRGADTAKWNFTAYGLANVVYNAVPAAAASGVGGTPTTN